LPWAFLALSTHAPEAQVSVPDGRRLAAAKAAHIPRRELLFLRGVFGDKHELQLGEASAHSLGLPLAHHATAGAHPAANVCEAAIAHLGTAVAAKNGRAHARARQPVVTPPDLERRKLFNLSLVRHSRRASW
jgi:hypothetical protein